MVQTSKFRTVKNIYIGFYDFGKINKQFKHLWKCLQFKLGQIGDANEFKNKLYFLQPFLYLYRDLNVYKK